MSRLLLASLLLLPLLTVSPAAQSAGNYLSFAQGEQWELVSGGQRMTLDVTGRTGDEWVVQWQNPFVNAQFHFVLRGEQVLLAGLDMGTGLAHLPPNTVYFDFGAKQGATWTNALGTIRVISRGQSISTPSGTYSNAIEFELVAKDKARTYWTFAPDVGFVQFGQGRGAFQLASRPSSRAGLSKPPLSAPPVPVDRPTDRPPAGKQGNSLLIGLDANPTATEGYDNRSKQNRMAMAIQSGVTFQYLHPKWNEVEPRAGSYKFDDLDFQTGLGGGASLPIAINLRTIDTNTRAMPAPYASWKWDDPRMADKLKAVLGALAPHLKGRVRWVAIGNEVDGYFSGHRGEIGPYATLISRVMPTVHQLFPNAKFSINFTYAAAADLRGMYSPFAGFLDYHSFTYYPLNGDFTFRDPSTASTDIANLVRAAGDRLVLFQEIGYASSTGVRSSEDQQARFLENVFEALRQNRTRIIGANFVWMSDLPESVVNDLTRYYRMGNGGNFKAFMATLGYWDVNGKPKKAWTVFSREAPTLR
jgi:hypothetical protein